MLAEWTSRRHQLIPERQNRDFGPGSDADFTQTERRKYPDRVRVQAQARSENQRPCFDFFTATPDVAGGVFFNKNEDLRFYFARGLLAHNAVGPLGNGSARKDAGGFAGAHRA